MPATSSEVVAVNPARVLVRLPNWVGDIVMALPAVHALRARWPDATLVGMVQPQHRELAARLGAFDDLIPAPAGAGVARARSVWWASRAGRAMAADVAVVMAPSFEAALTARLAGIRRRIGHATDRRRRLLTDAVPPRPEAHRADEYLDLVRVLGVSADAPVLGLSLTPDDRRYAARLFEMMAWPEGHRPIFVNPAAAKTARAWSSGRFRELAERLAAGDPPRPVIVHARPPFDGSAVWASTHGIALVSDATLPELAAVLERCALYVGNDSGPGHLAAAAGVPTVTVYGPSTPRRTGVRSQADVPHLVVSAAFACSPCRERFFEECPSPPSVDGRPPCLDEVTVTMVVDQVERALPASD